MMSYIFIASAFILILLIISLVFMVCSSKVVPSLDSIQLDLFD